MTFILCRWPRHLIQRDKRSYRRRNPSTPYLQATEHGSFTKHFFPPYLRLEWNRHTSIYVKLSPTLAVGISPHLLPKEPCSLNSTPSQICLHITSNYLFTIFLPNTGSVVAPWQFCQHWCLAPSWAWGIWSRESQSLAEGRHNFRKQSQLQKQVLLWILPSPNKTWLFSDIFPCSSEGCNT